MEPALPPDHETRVIDLRARRSLRRVEELERRAAGAEHDAQLLREQLAAAVLVRDRLAERVHAHDAELRAAQALVRAARQQATDRLAGEVRALARVGEVEAQLARLSSRDGGRAAHEAALARLAGELADAARLAREDVDRHLAARAQADAERDHARDQLAAERARAAEVVAALRAELEQLRGAHERAAVEQAQARAARRAQLEQLGAASERLRPPGEAPEGPSGMIVDLALAAERLRLQPSAEGDEQPVPEPAAPAASASLAHRPRGRALLRRARVRRVLAALRELRR